MSAFGRSITGLPYTYTVQGTLDAHGHLVALHAQGVAWSFVLRTTPTCTQPGGPTG